MHLRCIPYISYYFHMILSLKNIGLHYPSLPKVFRKSCTPGRRWSGRCPRRLATEPRQLRTQRQQIQRLRQLRLRAAAHPARLPAALPTRPRVTEAKGSAATTGAAPHGSQWLMHIGYSQTIYMSIVLVLEKWLNVFLEATWLCLIYSYIPFDFAPRPWTFKFASNLDLTWSLAGLRLPAPLWIELPRMRSCVWNLPLGRRQTPWKSPGIPWPSGFDSYQCYRKGHQKGHRKIRKSARFETFWDFRVPFAISWDVVFLHRLAFICPAIADCCVGLGFCDPVGWNWMTCSEHKNQNIPRDSCMWQWNTACRCWLFYVIFRFFIAHILVFFPYND